MTERRSPSASPRPPSHPALRERLLLSALTALGLTYVLVGDYSSLSLAVILTLIFVVYFAVRTMIFWENERFTPNRIQVGMSWILIGLDAETDEFDTRPVRVYAAILILMVAGLVLRPLVRALFFESGGFAT